MLLKIPDNTKENISITKTITKEKKIEILLKQKELESKLNNLIYIIYIMFHS
jgi:ribosomal protein L32E